MVTDKDIEKIKESLKDTFVTKNEFKAEIAPMKVDVAILKTDVNELKEDMKSVKETTQEILTVVDGIAKKFDDLKLEYVAVSIKGDRHEKWIKHLADKTENDLPDM